jgi:hypothetical protein
MKSVPINTEKATMQQIILRGVIFLLYLWSCLCPVVFLILDICSRSLQEWYLLLYYVLYRDNTIAVKLGATAKLTYLCYLF